MGHCLRVLVRDISLHINPTVTSPIGAGTYSASGITSTPPAIIMIDCKLGIVAVLFHQQSAMRTD